MPIDEVNAGQVPREVDGQVLEQPSSALANDTGSLGTPSGLQVGQRLHPASVIAYPGDRLKVPSPESAAGMWTVETVRANPMHTRLMVGR